MGGCQHLCGVVVLALVFRGIVMVIAGNSVQEPSIQVQHKKDGVYLNCSLDSSDTIKGWSKDGHEIGAANRTKLRVGLATDDPRGLYRCDSMNGHATLQLYFRMCQYCIQLNFATVLGMVAANILVTAFLAGAVWCLTAQQPSRLPQASDKQALLAHEQLYQPLGERNNGQYSHIGVAKARRR